MESAPNLTAARDAAFLFLYSERSGSVHDHFKSAGVASLSHLVNIHVTLRFHGTKHRPWLTALLARRPTKIVAIALANKIARMVWAMMVKGEQYKEPVALAA